MMECWNNGLAPFGQINACGGGNKKMSVVHDFMPARCHPETYAKDEG